MRRLAGLFSFLVVVFLIWSGAMMIRPAPDPQVPDPQVSDPQMSDPQAAAPRAGWNAPDLRGWLRHLPDLGSLWPHQGYTPQAVPDEPKALTSPIQRILVEKSARRMTVFQTEGPSKTYRIALGTSPLGTKARQGDGRTPEGTFRIDRLNDRSRFHLSLGIDYPQKSHRDAARRAGLDPGGDIMIHGQPNSIAEGFRVKGDWTEGCIAIDNAEIEEIFAYAAIGTQVEIRP